jgi:hypothetical protein
MRIRPCAAQVESPAVKYRDRRRFRRIVIHRGNTRVTRHTECFICSRIYFNRLLHSCPHCGSTTVRHYDSEDLNYFAQKLRADARVEPELKTTFSAKQA